MGTLTLYALKSAFVLTLLYLPFSLLLRSDKLFAFNRGVLLVIVLLSLLLPLTDVSWLSAVAIGSLEEPTRAIIEVGMPQVVGQVGPTTPQATASAPALWPLLLVGVYVAGLVVCLLLKARDVARLLRIIPRGCLWTEERGCATIYCHVEPIASFSFFRSIVISEKDYDESPEILRHELAHVSRGHSFDTMLLAIVEVLQWFNPCIWLLDLSLRDIHEYEADNDVLLQGVSMRQYQLLLIKKAVGSSSYALANSFNHSLLKKRIAMMMKKNQSKWSRAKALYMLPVAALAMCAFATPELANAVKASESILNAAVNAASDESRGKVTENLAEMQTSAEKIASAEPLAAEPEAETKAAAEPAVTPDDPPLTKAGDDVRMQADKMPEFPGGASEMMRYLVTSVRYPELPHLLGVQGRVIVGFVVRADGSITDAEVVHFKLSKKEPVSETTGETTVVSYAFEYDENSPDATMTKEEALAQAEQQLKDEALRVVNSMPLWTPGEQDGRKVNVRYNIPLTFKLQ